MNSIGLGHRADAFEQSGMTHPEKWSDVKDRDLKQFLQLEKDEIEILRKHYPHTVKFTSTAKENHYCPGNF